MGCATDVVDMFISFEQYKIEEKRYTMMSYLYYIWKIPYISSDHFLYFLHKALIKAKKTEKLFRYPRLCNERERVPPYYYEEGKPQVSVDKNHF